jgi:hypothetical protein
MQKSFHERPERTAAGLDDSGTLYPILLRPYRIRFRLDD